MFVKHGTCSIVGSHLAHCDCGVAREAGGCARAPRLPQRCGNSRKLRNGVGNGFRRLLDPPGFMRPTPSRISVLAYLF